MTPWSNIPIGEHLFLFSPMLALTATMLAVVACPLVAGRTPRVIAITASLGIVAAFVLAIRVADAVAIRGVSGLSTQPAAGLLIADNLSACFQIILIAFLGAVTYLWWLGSAETERNAPEFFVHTCSRRPFGVWPQATRSTSRSPSTSPAVTDPQLP